MGQWDFYHPSLSRIDCENLLKNKKNGSFLIRDSESTGCPVLSVAWDGKSHHYKVETSPHGMCLKSAVGVEKLYFDTFDKLVAHYQVPNRGIVYVLKDPVINREYTNEKEVEEDEEDSDYSDLDESESISQFFQQQIDILTGLSSDSDLRSFLCEYVQNDINKDFRCIKAGGNKPPMLQKLLLKTAQELQNSLENFLNRLKVLNEFFDVGSFDTQDVGDGLFSQIQECKNQHKDLELILKMLHESRGRILKLEEKVCTVLKEYSGQSENMAPKKSSNTEVEYSMLRRESSLGTMVPQKRKANERKIFEVTTGPLKSKSYIALDVKKGTMTFSKAQTETADNSVSYTSDQVSQLQKSKSSKVRLGILLENSSLKQYNFENYRSRELFCSTFQQIKIAHSKDKQSSQLSVFVGTWNMGNAASGNINEWFQCSGAGKVKVSELAHLPSDIYAIGTQESAYHEKEWASKIRNTMKEVFNKEFKVVTCYSMWEIRIVILIKPELFYLVNSFKQSSVKTGIANTLGNKGAVGVSFNVGSTSFCFINCHLTSGNEKLARRNQNFHSILRGLNLGQLDSFDLTLSFHHLFWFGDLNYRLDLEVADIIKSIMEKDWQNLVDSDQLCAEMRKGNVFICFNEEDLTFPPTYRYTRGTRSSYCWVKVKRTGNRVNVPSWCDRVLWRSYPHLTSCNTTYGCTENICTSDHSPVFATFDVGVASQTLSNDNTEDVKTSKDSKNSVKIIIYRAEAKVHTSSKTNFLLEFHSTCFERTVVSKRNSCFDISHKHESLFRGSVPDPKSVTYPWWANQDMCELKPVLSDPYYLENQHVLVAVKGEDGQESYGECVFSLKPLLSQQQFIVEKKITHLGVLTGQLKFVVQMQAPENYKYTPLDSKIYNLIRIEEENNDNRQSKILEMKAEPRKEHKHWIDIPADITLIDRSSIQQVDPIEKIVDSRHNFEKRISIGFDNPVVKLKKSSLTLPNKGKDQSDQHKEKGCPNQPPNLPPKRTLFGRLSLPNDVPNSTRDLSPNLDIIRKSLCTHSSPSLPRPSEEVTPEFPLPKPRLKRKEQKNLKFHNWLKEIGFQKYYQLLINNGYDELDFFSSITMEDLENVGIKDESERKMIVEQAKKLREHARPIVPV